MPPPPATPLVAAHDLSRSYGHGDDASHALRGASLEVAPGELVVVQGRSGSGKTTLLNLVSGLDRADSGTVHLFGEDLGALSVGQRLALRARDVGFVFQSPALVPELRLWENVAIAGRIKGMGGAEARDRALEALAAVGIEDLASRFPAQVSGGEAQRTSVARALVKRPRLVIADEPTASLDHDTARLVASVFAAFVASGEAAAVIATHDDVMASHGDRRLLLRDGVFVDEGSTE